MKLSKSLMGNTAHPRYDEFAEQVKQFEAKYGDDWDDTMIEYDSDFVRLPLNVYKAAGEGNLRTVLQWLGKGNIKEMVNATKCEEDGSRNYPCPPSRIADRTIVDRSAAPRTPPPPIFRKRIALRRCSRFVSRN